MYTPREIQTLLYALNVLPLPTYLSMFLVPFVVVDSTMQRTSSKNSNVFFPKLFHLLTRLLSLVLTLTKKLLFLMEVILLCPMITPPKCVKWRRHHVSDLHIQDDLQGDIGLTFRRIDGCLPFIRLPRNMSLDIIGRCGLDNIYKALQACENLRTPLCRSNKKRVFTDFGKTPKYACVGPQVSRNSPTVHDHPSFMDKLPSHHWKSLLWLMRRAEESFKSIADHQVISHLHHAKNAVPFKTFTPSNINSTSSKFFGGIAFGTNVFLRCHTDQDFTMSISQVFVKEKSRYLLNDDIIVFFCFPTLGVAVPLGPGDYLLFNPLIPHCISSRCKQEDEIMCVSMYLKTAIVGLNDYLLPLTPEDVRVSEVKWSLGMVWS